MPIRSPAAILFVEDDVAARGLTAEVLRRAGFDVWEASTGCEALRLARRRPDLVLLDVRLPDLSGFEVCRRLRSEPATASVPVLHLSGAAGGSADRTQGLEGGADGYLVKPVEPAELIAQVRALLRLSRTEDALHESEKRYRLIAEDLAALSRRLLEVQEAERRRIAHELHDQVGQALTALKITLHTAHQLTADGPAAPLLRDAVGRADRIVQQVRTLSLELHPPMMDDLGLVAALRWHVRGVTERSGLVIQLVADASAGRLPAELEMACFRVVQEALNNVVKHARASKASVALRREGDKLRLTVRDDGVGFDVDAARKHAGRGSSLGLLGMEERVLLLGGHFRIHSAAGHGAEVRADFPLGLTASRPERDKEPR